jgi:hypothetical protein
MFNVHNNKTADGVVITVGLKVVTNECEQAVILSDDNDTEYNCCAPTDSHTELASRDDYTADQLHPSGQVRIEGVYFTDHTATCEPSVGGYAACRHNHWFRVSTKNGTKSFDGERLGAYSYGGVRVEA